MRCRSRLIIAKFGENWFHSFCWHCRISVKLLVFWLQCIYQLYYALVASCLSLSLGFLHLHFKYSFSRMFCQLTCTENVHDIPGSITTNILWKKFKRETFLIKCLLKRKTKMWKLISQTTEERKTLLRPTNWRTNPSKTEQIIKHEKCLKI